MLILYSSMFILCSSMSYFAHPCSYLTHLCSYCTHPCSYLTHPCSYLTHPCSYFAHPCHTLLIHVILCSSMSYFAHPCSYCSHTLLMIHFLGLPYHFKRSVDELSRDICLGNFFTLVPISFCHLWYSVSFMVYGGSGTHYPVSAMVPSLSF